MTRAADTSTQSVEVPPPPRGWDGIRWLGPAFLWIASATDRMGDNRDELWDEEDGFFYDLLRLPNGETTRLKVRSLVGLLPICAVTVLDACQSV